MGVGYLDIVDILSITLIILSTTVLTPILVYYLYRFHKIEHTEFAKHRNPPIVYAINILTIICFSTERIFAMFTEVIYYQYHTLPLWSVSICDNLTVIIVYVLCVIRAWLLYYNWKHHTKIVENVWKKDINPDQVSWFIRNKNKYGYFNPVFLRIAFIPSVLFIAVEIGSDIVLGGPGIHDHILNMFLPFTLFILFLYMYYKIKDFHDAFNVRKELYYQCIALCIVLCVAILDIIIFFIVDAVEHHTHYHYLERVEWLTSAIITYSILFIFSLISTAYPVYLSTGTINNQQNLIETTKHDYDFLSMLKDISTVTGYKQFMDHLVRCLATENLLFITELIQIKYNMQMKYNNIITTLKMSDLAMLSNVTSDTVEFEDSFCVTIDFNQVTKIHSKRKSKSKSLVLNMISNSIRSDTDIKTESMIEKGVAFSGIFNEQDHMLCKIYLPLKLPHSKILDEHNNFIDQMDCLFRKYVNIQSDFEINISSDTRKFLINVFENIQNIKCKENYLFNIMDSACVEILKLCHNSYLIM